MSRIATAVHVVTTDGPAGRSGATISAFCSVTDEPASVLVCVNRTTRAHDAILKNRVFCVNTLGAGHQDLSDAFAGREQLDMKARFGKAEWIPLITGCPGLSDARLSVDCEISGVSEVGTHSIIVGRVVDLRMRTGGTSLLYIQRGYEQIEK
ncbi:flavin reductase [Roseibium sp. RKSG952]|nr:flavin reductase [Roseibium sp. RKSG952]